MPRLVLSDISKRYDDVIALDHVSFEVQDGELLVLVGPSGCGKSTTLRLIAGLESLQAGNIALNGTDITTTAPKDRDIAMVFQNYALYPHMTVRQNLGFGLKMKKMSSSKIESRVKETAEALDIESLLDRKPGQLSGGQKQRVAVGRVMIRKPAVFLFDEPLSNLDAKLRVTLRNELIRLHQRLAATILYVTHDQIEALTLGDRIAVMKDGQIQQLGTPQQVYNEPANTFVASFIGHPAMNLVPPSVFRLETDATLVGIRPEHLIISVNNPGSIPGTISARQNTGADSFLTGKFKEWEITVRAPADTRLNVGDTIEIIPVVENLHFFNQTGLRISNG